MTDGPAAAAGAGAVPRGRLFILSAPSGAGKSTLCSRLRRRFRQLRYSVSHTTRSPRRGEIDGLDYHFITRPSFEAGIRTHRWAEWAEVHGNYYGTSAEFIESCLEKGQNVLLDIDVQGARQILKHYPQSVTIFIAPPSMAVLEKRLKTRATDSDQAIARRLRNAVEEMDHQSAYRHVVVNDDLETATEMLIDIVAGYL